jgi:hypothetical protein
MTWYYKEKKKKNIFGKYLPVTLNLETSKNMSENAEFNELKEKKEKQIWICKPGEYANRGKGIVVIPNLDLVQKFLQSLRAGEKWVV